MRKITKAGIVMLNKEAILNDGGNFTPPYNLLNESNLDYLVDIVDSEMFGQPLYPVVYDKASVLFFNIICNHIFMDGNKRTGLVVALTYLEAHNFQLKEEITQEILLAFVLKVASGESSLDECREWFKDHIVVL